METAGFSNDQYLPQRSHLVIIQKNFTIEDRIKYNRTNTTVILALRHFPIFCATLWWSIQHPRCFQQNREPFWQRCQ